MSRTHSRIVLAAALAWGASLAMMLTQLAHLPEGVSDFWRVASVNVGALAACLTTVGVLPYMLREFYQEQVTDYIGSYLAGWAGAQEVEPEEPVRLHSVG